MSQKKKRRLKLQQKIEEVRTSIKIPDISLSSILKRHWKFLIIIAAGVTLLYLNSLNGAFVSDDYATISQNPQAGDMVFGLKNFFPSLANSILATIFGVKSPFPFHLFSLILYLGVIITWFVFGEILFGEEIAKISSIIFALMPIHVEAVSWISGKPYLGNALSIGIFLDIILMYLIKKEKKYIWPGIISFLLIFYFEPVRGLAVFLLLSLIFTAFSDRFAVKISFKKIFTYLIPAVLLVLVLLWPRIYDRISTVNSGYNSSESIFYNPFFQYPTSMAKYLQLTLVPTDLTLYHTMYIFPTWLNWTILLTYLSATIYFFFKDKKIFFALAFIFAAALPSMAPVKVSWLVAERYMFLGSFGMALLLGLLIEKIGKKYLLIIPAILALFVILYGFRVYIRNIDWQTNHNLWVNTVEVSPNSHNAWNNIGDDYDKLAMAAKNNSEKASQFENAIKGFTQSTVVKQNYADAYHNRANILFKIGRLDLARQSYEAALKYSPGLYQTYLSLTQIDLMEKKLDLAIQHSQQAIEIQPNNPQMYYVYGIVLSQVGRLDEAKKAMLTAVNLAPDYQPAKAALAQLQQYTMPAAPKQ